MAVTPLFFASTTALKAELRLTDSDAAGDVQKIIERAIQQVRTNIYVRLGVTRVNLLVALPVVENPVTNDGLLRQAGSNLEALWTRVLLMDTLPAIHLDASGGAQESYNDEGTFRKTDEDDRAAMRERAMEEIERLLEFLGGGTLGDMPQDRAWVSDPEVRPEPGDTVFPDQIILPGLPFPERVDLDLPGDA